MSSALAATTLASAATRACTTPSRARLAGTTARAPCRPFPRSPPFPSSIVGASRRVEAGAGVGPTDDARLKRAEEDSLAADADADADDHSHDDHDDHDDDASAVTTEHGSALWRDFALAAVGSWGGCCVEFDADGVARDIPLRYVHGVGRVPAANMPFREPELDWMTKCETAATGDGLAVRTKRAMPEVGNEDAVSSCGGAEWGEHVAFVEDEPIFILKGANEDKTILPDGSFSAGARVLSSAAGAVDAVHHCLAHPDDANTRVRVVHRIRGNGSGATSSCWRTSSIDVWFERRGTSSRSEARCVVPFANAARLATADLAGRAASSRWRYVPEASAVYFLMWDDDEYETDAKDADTKSFFTMLADAGEAEDLVFMDDQPENSEGALAPALDGLVRLPGNVWVYCGPAGGHDVGVGAGGEEGQLVLECGWQPGDSSKRTVSTRAYDAESGRLDSVSLAREATA